MLINHDEHLEDRWTSSSGLDCVVKGNSFSGAGYYHLCGYVRIPQGHPLHGISYDSSVPPSLSLEADRVMQGEIGKRGIFDVFLASMKGSINVGMLFNTHGGITWSDTYAPGQPEVEGEWWYGFDCGHAGDSPEVQNSAYVRRECELLAEQIASMMPKLLENQSA